MYTRCPQCSTIFRVTAAQLRVALGEVSCGSCHTTFNALNALTDELPELTEAVVLDPLEAPPAGDSRDETGPESGNDENANDRGAGLAVEEHRDEPDAQEFEEIVIEATGVDDGLIDTVADDATDTESQGEATGESADEIERRSEDDGYIEESATGYQADAHEEFDEGDQEPVAISAEGLSVETLADDRAEEAPAAESPAAEPLYDDDTGIEEVLPEVASEQDEAGAGDADEDNAANAWAGILADVDDRDRLNDRREPEEAARTTGEDKIEAPGTVEPTYDDNTGIEETLSEEDFDQSHDGDDAGSSRDRDDPLEFNAPEQSWSEIFAPTDSLPLAAPVSEPDDDRVAEPDEPLDLSPLSPLESETADPDEWAGFLSELTPGGSTPDEAAPEADTAEEDEEGPIIVLGSADAVVAADDPSAATTEVDPLIDYEPEFVPPWESEPPESDAGEAAWRRPSNRHLTIAAVLILALGLQLIHYNRDSLATHTSLGQPIRSAYGALGRELYPDWDLKAYRISGSEAVAGRTAPGVLDIMANVVITGDEAVGMPMIRVTLRDRWSNTVASRVFAPTEYLRDFDARPTLLSPGTTLPIEISVADPGTEAHGYVVDVCLPRRTSGLHCQIEKSPFQ